MIHTINLSVDFADLHLSYERSGEIALDWAAVRIFCQANGFEFAEIKASEDKLSALVTTWYYQHKSSGGALDSVMEQLISESDFEASRGGGFSYAPGMD